MDINDINKNKTVWELISEKLKNNGIDVFPPATHTGECKKPYVVVKKDGSSQIKDYSSQTVYYRFMLYVPRNKYSYLDEYEKIVKGILDSELYPLIMLTGQSEPDYYDDNYNAHMRAFLYRNNTRVRHL